MILVREVFQAKFGQGDGMVALFKEARGKWLKDVPTRLLVDLTGRFFTVVIEIEVEGLADWEALMARFAETDDTDWFGRLAALVESGQREFYTIAA